MPDTFLLSKHVAEDLEQYPHWQPHLHELGECEVKHGVRLSVVNLHTADLGTRQYGKAEGGAYRCCCCTKKTGRVPVAVVRDAGCARCGRFSAFRYGRPVATAGVPEKSVAVLPFENRSRDPDNAYFADGIQDEILTRLSKKIPN